MRRRRRARDPRRRPPDQRDDRQRRPRRLAGVPDGARTVYAWAPSMRPGSADDDGQRRRGRRRRSRSRRRGRQRRASTSRRMTHAGDRRRGHQPERPRQQRGLQLRGAHRRRRRDPLASAAPCPPTASTAAAAAAAAVGSCWRRRRRRRARHAYPSFQGGVPLLQWLVIPARTGLPEGVLPGLDGRAEPGLAASSRCATARPRSTCRAASRSRRRARPQQASVSLPDIRGGQDAATNWIVRGDSRGRALPARPLLRHARPDRPARSSLEARLAEPIKVYGGSAMQIVVDTDDRFDDRYPAPRPRRHQQHLAGDDPQRQRCTIPAEGEQGYVAQPQPAPRVDVAASIAPGETWFPDAAGDPDDDLIIVPRDRPARSNLAESFVAQAAGESPNERVADHHAPAGAARGQAPS